LRSAGACPSGLSYRDVEELLAESEACTPITSRCSDGLERYAPEMERRLRSRLKPTNGSWRVDEMYIRVKGKWRYLYRAVDSSGASLDFLLSAKQDAAESKALPCQSALAEQTI